MLKFYYAEGLFCWRFILSNVYYDEGLICWSFILLKFYYAAVLLCWRCILLKIYFVVSGDSGPIIRRNNCVFATHGTCYSVWMTVWYAGAYAPAYQTVIHTEQVTCIAKTQLFLLMMRPESPEKNKFCTKLILFTKF